MFTWFLVWNARSSNNFVDPMVKKTFRFGVDFNFDAENINAFPYDIFNIQF